MTKRGGTQYLGWDRHAYLLAELIDAVQGLTYVTSVANAKKPRQVPEPKPYPRPDGPDPEKKIDPLLAKLRGEDNEPKKKVRPGALIPLPPNLPSGR